MDTDETWKANVAETVHAITRRYCDIEELSILDGADDSGACARLASVPEGRKLVDLEQYLEPLRERPRFLKGTARHDSVDSLIAHVNRFKDEHSALYLKSAPGGGEAALTAVYDYHEKAASPRHGRHRAVYAFPFSEEFKAWQAKNGQTMNQAEFAEFIEDRIVDIVMAPARDSAAAKGLEKVFELADKIGGDFASPQKMMELSRGLKANVAEKVVGAVTLQTGEMAMEFSHEHHDETGEKLNVPGLFLIAIPVFRDGAPYQLLGRLRYRLKGGVVWFYELARLPEAVDHAVGEVAERVREETGLPLFRGSPEG